MDNATVLSPPVFRCVGNGTTEAWYQFNASAGDHIRAYLEPLREDQEAFDTNDMCLYPYENGTVQPTVGCSDDRDCCWPLKQYMLEHQPKESGTWYLRVLTTEYKLSLTLNKQSEEGSYLVGDEIRILGDPVWNVNQRLGPSPYDGIDGDWVRLDSVGTANERLEVTATTEHSGLTNAFVTLYNETGERIEGEHCEYHYEHITCGVPNGAAWVLVESYAQVKPGYELTYLY